ncbi:MAG: hypothetical protein IJJ99_02265 [Oscillospiraceae bacterium]|nr:hypothetical protein [Oscillospiraceae bacterium]
MKQAKLRNGISLAMNALIFLMVLFSVVWILVSTTGGSGGVTDTESGDRNAFRYFTVDSNILAALTCLLMIPYNIKSLVRGEDAIPKWALTLKMIGTVAVALTFAVVMLYFLPLVGFGAGLISGANLFLHLLCPLLAMISFCLFERGLFVTKTRLLLGIVPSVIYGTVYLINVIFLQRWEDFYYFNVGGYWYITFLLFPVLTYLLALGIRAVHNRFDKQPQAVAPEGQ